MIDQARRQRGLKLTMTHVVTQAVARAFAEHPELNAKVGLGGRILQRETVDVFVSVATDGGRDLTGVRLDEADALSLEQIAAGVAERVESTRKDEDPTYRRSRDLMRRLPSPLLRPMLWLTDVLTNELHLHLPAASMPRDPFGSVVVTNVGMFGIDTAFAPFVPLARCPMLLLVTAVRERPWVVKRPDGSSAVEPRPVLRLCATFDHRIVDGAAAGRLAESIVRWVESPLGGTSATNDRQGEEARDVDLRHVHRARRARA